MPKGQYTNKTIMESNRSEERRKNWQMQMSQHKATLKSGIHGTLQSNSGQWWRNTVSHCSPHHPERTSYTPSIETLPESAVPLHGLKMTGSVNSARRQSFLYRIDHSVDRSGLKLDRCNSPREREDGQFITPFAQVLSILKRAHSILTQYSKQNEINKPNTSKREKTEEHGNLENQGTPVVSEAELEHVVHEFDWCLEVLESLQCKRSVSSLARAKFCRILSRELSTSLSLCDGVTGMTVEEEDSEHLESDKSAVKPQTGINKPKNNKFRPYLSKHLGRVNQQTMSASSSQVSDYIYKTFVEDDGVLEMEYAEEMKEETCSPESCKANGEVAVQTSKATANTPNATTDSELEAPLSGIQLLEQLWRKDAKFDVNLVSQFVEKNKQCCSPDLFELDRLSNHHPLSTFGIKVLQDRGILGRFSIPVPQMYHFLHRAEQLYHADAPFHNSIHATDVLHTMDNLFCFNDLQAMFCDLEIFSTLFACIIHDIDHPAVTNQYLINTNNELAILYNDKSVLENHHLYIAFDLLHSDPSVDITKHLTTGQRQLFRKIVINLVLATDMSKHMTLLADLKTLVESQRASGSNKIKLDTLAVRMQILECLVHAADLSNPTKPLNLYRQWVDRITEEMFRQGDREREAGLEISPMCDRQTACVATSQVSFIDYIVYPLWETLSELLHPDAKPLMDDLQTNREWYASLEKSESQDT